MLDLGLVGECAKAEVGGRSLGWRVAPPYTYALHGEMQKGENLLRIEVVNSLVHEVPDWFSTYMQIPPSGLLGPVRLGY